MPEAAPAAAPASSPAPSTPSAAPASPPAPSSTPAPAPAVTSATPAPEAGKATATPPPPKRYRAKVNGEDREIDAAHVDALAQAFGISPDEVLQGGRMTESSFRRWEEAAKIRKEAERREAEQKKRFEDPRITEIKAKEPGISDEDAWALLRVQELYEKSQMNPDQRALAEERSKREALEKQAKEREEEAKQAKLAAETKSAAAKVDREATEAMQKHGMPKDPKWARAVFDHLAAMIRAGAEPDVEAAVLHVKRLVQADDRSRLAALSDEQLEGWLGKAIVDRVLRRSVAKVNGGGPTPPTPPPAPAPKEAETVIYDADEWRRRYRD